MPSDFWAGYASGVAALVIGNPLDVIKVRLQASSKPPPGVLPPQSRSVQRVGDAKTLLRGLPAPILTYGALNGLLFASYNRSLAGLSSFFSHANDDTRSYPYKPWMHWVAGAIGGLVTFVISAPTELIKCRAQVLRGGSAASPQDSASSSRNNSWDITKQVLRQKGLLGLYHGGVVTSIRDSVGYAFYFWTYELAKGAWVRKRAQKLVEGGVGQNAASSDAVMILVCGGAAGVATWASVFPLDVIKTRVQTESVLAELRGGTTSTKSKDPTSHGAWSTARHMWRTEGVRAFWRGMTICCARAFIVNAAQWTVYEWMMR